MFQSTHSYRVRRKRIGQLQNLDKVSIHALVQSATMWPRIISFCCNVSIHALVQSATVRNILSLCWFDVSIHALVQSATMWPRIISFCCNVSIHALVQSATYGVHRGKAPTLCFNPRTRTECDAREYLGFSTENKVSIHALVQSATILV